MKTAQGKLSIKPSKPYTKARKTKPTTVMPTTMPQFQNMPEITLAFMIVL